MAIFVKGKSPPMPPIARFYEMPTNCPICHWPYEPPAKYCIRCKAALENRCVGCGALNGPQARFCKDCGKRLRDPACSAGIKQLCLRIRYWFQDWPHDPHKVQNAAKFIKAIVQMLIGIGAVVFVFVNLKPNVNGTFASDILKTAAVALACSAAVDLVYMLFTPGPDEAVDPLILGMSATALYLLHNQLDDHFELQVQHVVPLVLLVVLIGFLVGIKNKFPLKNGAQ
jgi:hypothetical protein